MKENCNNPPVFRKNINNRQPNNSTISITSLSLFWFDQNDQEQNFTQNFTFTNLSTSHVEWQKIAKNRSQLTSTTEDGEGSEKKLTKVDQNVFLGGRG